MSQQQQKGQAGHNINIKGGSKGCLPLPIGSVRFGCGCCCLLAFFYYYYFLIINNNILLYIED